MIHLFFPHHLHAILQRPSEFRDAAGLSIFLPRRPTCVYVINIMQNYEMVIHRINFRKRQPRHEIIDHGVDGTYRDNHSVSLIGSRCCEIKLVKIPEIHEAIVLVSPVPRMPLNYHIIISLTEHVDRHKAVVSALESLDVSYLGLFDRQNQYL
jgi:hypothetical protein